MAQPADYESVEEGLQEPAVAKSRLSPLMRYADRKDVLTFMVAMLNVVVSGANQPMQASPYTCFIMLK